ncbi:MAG: hypothetical protein JWP95_209 [Actinotalea sp.]|nr:hypothetical protein [Actinotalea sp.]
MTATASTSGRTRSSLSAARTRTERSARRRRLERAPWTHRRPSAPVVVAGLGVIITMTRQEIYLNVTLGTLTALALLPVWVPALRRYRGAPLLAGLILLCLPAGAWLTTLSSETRFTSDKLLIASSVLLVNVLLGTGMLLWARTLMQTSTVAVLAGVGMLLSVPGEGRLDESLWRFGFAVPVTVLVLGIAWRVGRRWFEVVCAAALAAVTAADGGRSLFAILVLAAVLVAWQAQPRVLHVSVSRLRTSVLLATALWALYTLAESLTLEGYLGQVAQRRTLEQLATSGSVILGGRPEQGASMALFQERPIGFGAGTRINSEDMIAAKSGMADLGYDPNNGYVENYMFGDGIELHSYLADLWSDFGLLGLLLGGVMFWHLGRHLSERLAHRTASALIVYLGVQNAWNLLFSPRYGSVTLMALALGLMLALRSEDGSTDVGRDRLYSEKVPPAAPSSMPRPRAAVRAPRA